MGNDYEEHAGNMLRELDSRLNSTYRQGHIKATPHAQILTWREKTRHHWAERVTKWTELL